MIGFWEIETKFCSLFQVCNFFLTVNQFLLQQLVTNLDIRNNKTYNMYDDIIDDLI